MTRRRTFALLIDYYGGEYQLGLLRGVEEAAIRSDTNLVVVVGRWLNAQSPIEAIQNDIYRHIQYPSVDAVIIAPGCLSHCVSQEQLTEFFASFSKLPVTSVSVQVPGIPSLVLDNRRAQQRIVEHLIESHQCSRIAYISGPASSFEARDRTAGYKDALERHQIIFDPLLCGEGNFWTDTAGQFANQLLDRGIAFDAFVAANDYMAVGAIDALKRRGVRVPQDVRVVGFDDVASARMACPPLTTVRQPLQRMGSLAVEILGHILDGRAVEEVHRVDLELVRRESCGCARGAVQVSVSNSEPQLSDLTSAELSVSQEQLQRRLLDVIHVPNDRWQSVIETLASTLFAEFSNSPGSFLRALADLLEQNSTRVELLEQFYNIIEALRGQLRDYFSEPRRFEDLCHSAILMVSEWIHRAQLRALFDQNNANNNLGASVERLSIALTPTALSESLDVILHTTAIRSACLSLYEGGQTSHLQSFCVTGSPRDAELRNRSFETVQLAPAGFLPTDRRYSFVLMPLSYGDSLYGQALFEVGDQYAVYTMLRDQIGSAVKTVELHRTVVEETARRERAERARLEQETEIAKQIQTAMLPDSFNVPGLEIAALMHPAATIGGDYYDVIPTNGGCFIAIGDVTGHGLLAGMIMLMVQSMVTVMIRANADQSPCQLLPPLNRALYDNIRNRLHGTDHVTLTLIKYRRDGSLILSGAHEDALIWRQRSGQCERVNSPGFWLAAIEDVEPLTTDLEAQLEDGDVLVLYTDGVTESMNETREQFGLERLIAVVERHGLESPAKVCAAVVQAIAAWSTSQLDDVSLLVARYARSTDS